MTADRFRIVNRHQIVGPKLPVTVQGLIYANLAMFTIMAAWGTYAGMGPSVLLNPSVPLTLHAGGQYWPQVINHGEWWRCITYFFSHGGLIHLGFNMMVLYQIGPMVERELEWKAFLFLYLFSGLTATFAGFIWQPNTPVVGASGAIFGLAGFAITFYHRIGNPLAIARRNALLQWALIMLVIGFVLPRVDNAGHIGGLVGGGLLGLITPISYRGVKAIQSALHVLGWFSLVVIVIAHLGLILSWFR